MTAGQGAKNLYLRSYAPCSPIWNLPETGKALKLIEREVDMANFNQWIGMGNLTRDPELSYTPGQTPVVNFGLAVNRKWTKKDETTGEEVLFIECRVWGKRAEVVSKHFKKGDPIFVVGHLKLETWEKDDQKFSRIRVIADNFEFVGKKPE